ncbi:hypothetical protein CO044_03085 [Candidatus Peregrinibacteria bacterium CG_4_9_14_0_2_um_filter_38_9]|nr:MAG: hypothetical protein CO044_03085 [Candidatus Peregrinibacteria bacterium CG_4_9_14_0_2_um_filter_38_9]
MRSKTRVFGLQMRRKWVAFRKDYCEMREGNIGKTERERMKKCARLALIFLRIIAKDALKNLLIPWLPPVCAD